MSCVFSWVRCSTLAAFLVGISPDILLGQGQAVALQVFPELQIKGVLDNFPGKSVKHSRFAKAKYDTDRSEGGKPQSDPADPVNAALSFDAPIPIRLLGGTLFFFGGMLLIRRGVISDHASRVVVGWVLVFLSGALWIPCLP